MMELWVPRDTFIGFPRELIAAHDRLLRRFAARRWQRTAHFYRHRDDWRAKLSIVTGLNIPPPAYVSIEQVGLPMKRQQANGQFRKHRYWKISAGRGSQDWPLFRDGSFIALSWYDEPVDPTDFPNDREEFIRRLLDETTVSRAGAESVWEFRSEVSVGDEVLVYSRFEVLGQGTVAGPYRYVGEEPDYRHRRSVRWTSVRPMSTSAVSADLQQKLSRQQTLIELNADEFGEATGRWTLPTSHLAAGFAAAGLTYTESQIASFYSALQTKGFVILSGISGTGKSKIAQRFADMLPDVIAEAPAVLAEDFVQIAVRPYMKKYKRIRLWNEVSEGLPVPPNGMSIMVPFSIDGQEGTCRVWNRPETNAGTYLFPQGELGERFREVLEDNFALRFHVNGAGDQLASIEMRTEVPTQQVAEAAELQPNHLFLPVRPDWRDGKPLIGYHNPLSGEYVRTPFLDFVLAASDDYRAGNRNAFFVILDEMNLAHVEYYFADVLSVIESGRDEEGWTVEGIPLAVGEEDADLPETLRLPPNLYIVGTVNMDETTHPFSPKVLDRAFTIELTDVSFDGYPPEPVEGADLSDEEKRALLEAFTRRGRYPRIDKAEIHEVIDAHPRYREDLQSLNTSLRRHRMHFGYRVFDEIMQFVHHAQENELFTPDEAFDHAVLMKVLPKFNGSRGKLQHALFDLIHWCRQDGALDADGRRELETRFAGLLAEGRPFDSIVTTTDGGSEDDWRYPATGRRVALMMQDLYTAGFASFG